MPAEGGRLRQGWKGGAVAEWGARRGRLPCSGQFVQPIALGHVETSRMDVGEQVPRAMTSPRPGQEFCYLAPSRAWPDSRIIECAFVCEGPTVSFPCVSVGRSARGGL